MTRWSVPRRRHLVSAVVAVATLAVAGAGCGGGGSSSSTTTTTSPPKPATPVAVTESQLRTYAASVGHPIFWAGPRGGTYELTTISDGRTYIRYLPPGTPVGSPTHQLTIGTYIRPVAPYAIVKAAAESKHATIRFLPDSSVAVRYPGRPDSVFIVFPGKLYEVEVFAPSPAEAFRIATSGKVVPLA